MEQTIIDPAEAIQTGFNYATLEADDAEFLRNQAAYINARRHMTHMLITEMGGALLAAKKRLPGVFLVWARSEFGFSEDTIENYMNVAQNFPALASSGGAAIQARALYVLSRDTTPASARTEAGQIAAAGDVVDYKTAYILAESPVEVKTAYLSEELPKEAAYDLARAYKKKSLPSEVREVCLAQKVTSPDLIDYLTVAYLDWNRTKGTIHERSTWGDIAADNWILNGVGWSIPLADVRPVDIQRYKVDRAAMHRDIAPKRWQWFQTDGLVEQTPDGRYIIVLEKPEFETLEGHLIMMSLRLPIQEPK